MTGGEPEEDGTSYGFRETKKNGRAFVRDILFLRASSPRANNFRRFEVGASFEWTESPTSRFFDG
jgi:hypothetical protein